MRTTTISPSKIVLRPFADCAMVAANSGKDLYPFSLLETNRVVTFSM